MAQHEQNGANYNHTDSKRTAGQGDAMPTQRNKQASGLTVDCVGQLRWQACCPGELAQGVRSSSTGPPQARTVVSAALAVQHLHVFTTKVITDDRFMQVRGAPCRDAQNKSA